MACAPAERPERAWTPAFQAHVLAFLMGLYHGVYAMEPAFPVRWGPPPTWAGPGPRGMFMRVCAFLRSARPGVGGRAGWPAHGPGGRPTVLPVRHRLPSWPGDRANPWRRCWAGGVAERTGRTLELSAVHVGLEPSVFRAKAPGLVAASAGPDILDAHSVDERAPLDELPDYALRWPGRWKPFNGRPSAIQQGTSKKVRAARRSSGGPAILRVNMIQDIHNLRHVALVQAPRIRAPPTRGAVGGGQRDGRRQPAWGCRSFVPTQ